MKNLIAAAFLFAAGFSFGQDNTIPTTGNVGIGTLTPSARLDVNGNMIVDSCMHIKDSILIEDNARIMSDMKVEGETTLLGNTKIEGELYLTNIQPENIADGKILYAMPNGKIGSGEPNEVGDLIYQKQCAPDNGVVSNPVWNNGDNKIFVNCPEVNVGINTDIPRTRLDVIGNTYTTNLAVGVDPANRVGRLHIRKTSAPGPDIPIMIVESNVQSQPLANERVFQINSDGLTRVRELKVDAQDWSDYVFEEEYVLMPLTEVEKYIEQNGHLPNVPSEEEVLENGINVAEMNKILLQKIEELTLHIIEQEKRIKELEKK